LTSDGGAKSGVSLGRVGFGLGGAGSWGKHGDGGRREPRPLGHDLGEHAGVGEWVVEHGVGAVARAGGVVVDGRERRGRLRQRREDGVGAEGELVGMGESDDGVLPAGRGATKAVGRRVGERGVQRRDAGHVGRRRVGDGGLLHRAGVGEQHAVGDVGVVWHPWRGRWQGQQWGRSRAVREERAGRADRGGHPRDSRRPGGQAVLRSGGMLVAGERGGVAGARERTVGRGMAAAW
jgi:hypothetical protein